MNLPDAERIRLGSIDSVPINRFVSGSTAVVISDQRNISVALDSRILAYVEEHRVNDIQLYVEFQLSLLEWGEAPPFTSPRPDNPPRLGQPHTLHASLSPIIPQSLWIENVLKPAGHGEIHLVEIPLGNISRTPLLFNSLTALKKAEKFLKSGDYDEAAGACRVALEGYFKPEDSEDPKNKNQVLKKDWRKALGEQTYVWLDAVLREIKIATNPPHHNPSARYSRQDAQMLVVVTSVILSFVGRSLRRE